MSGLLNSYNVLRLVPFSRTIHWSLVICQPGAKTRRANAGTSVEARVLAPHHGRSFADERVKFVAVRLPDTGVVLIVDADRINRARSLVVFSVADPYHGAFFSPV